MTAHKKTLCVDFDGVVHAYTSPWVDAETIVDGPVPGAFEFLEKAVKVFDVHIYSSRSKTEKARYAMAEWFMKHGLRDSVQLKLQFSAEKPSAFMTIDDRAFCFEGVWPDLEKLAAFKPWNKRM